jgi:DNA polymerase-1
MIFSLPQPRLKKDAVAPYLSRVEIATHSSLLPIAPLSSVLYPVRAGEMARVGPAEVRARYGVDPAQVPDFITLRGDPSDKVPGAAGVGAIGAATLLQRYGSLEAALAAGRFPTQAESLRLFRSIATMNRKAPLPSLRGQKPTWAKAAALARKWELKQLARRLEEFAKT